MRTQLPDFDTLLEIAQQDPEGYERFRTQQVESAIQSSTRSEQPRLRCLQFQIDSQRRLHSNPLGCCIKISQMMEESFFRLQERLTEITTPFPQAWEATQPENEGAKDQPQSASIIQFPKQ